MCVCVFVCLCVCVFFSSFVVCLFLQLFKKDKGTKSSDVYSFGIILWEILTRRTPYQGMIRASNHLKAIQDIANGMRPEIPAQCPPRYAQLMQACWNADPNKRPTFQEIVDVLLELEKEKIEANVVSKVVQSSSIVNKTCKTCRTANDVLHDDLICVFVYPVSYCYVC